MKHVIDGHELSLKQVKQPQVPDIAATLPLVTGGGTIVVRGYQHPISQEMIDLYFTNASKSGGGEIADIVMREEEVYIVFTEQTGMLYQELIIYFYLVFCLCDLVLSARRLMFLSF